MPLQRFTDPDDARRALWVDRGRDDLATRIRRLWAFSGRLVELRIPRGLRKFRSIEEANADRDAWVDARVRALRKSRRGRSG